VWRAKTLPIKKLRWNLPSKIPQSLRDRIGKRIDSEGLYLRPFVVGCRVVKNSLFVHEAQMAGHREIPCFVQEEGSVPPPMAKPIYLTVDQRPVVKAALERFRELGMDGARQDEIKEGRLLELLSAELLSEWGWPQGGS